MTDSDNYIDKELEKEENKKVLTDIEKLEQLLKKKEEGQDVLTKNIRKVLLYSGFIGAGISALSYLIATSVMINGVSSDLSFQNQMLFSALGAIVGILISTLLRSQGILYAKQNPEVKEIMSSYTTAKNKALKNGRLHMIGWYMFWALVRDVFIKGSSVAVSTFLIVYIFVEGSGDWALLWLAISNIGLFSGFGLVSLSKMYENYIEKHLPAVIQRTIRLRDEPKAILINFNKLEEIKKGERLNGRD